MSITGKDLIELGLEPGKKFGEILKHVQDNNMSVAEMIKYVEDNKPEPKITLNKHPSKLIWNMFLRDTKDMDQIKNADAVYDTMVEVLKTPNTKYGVIMPDACPAGPLGTIPVGGVVATEGTIHPGMHSADVCCSVMATEFDDAEPKDVLDMADKHCKFGAGGRDDQFYVDTKLYESMMGNPFLNDKKTLEMAMSHMCTQGDGNHFVFVGKNKLGKTYMITHHGSRGVGAMLYKKGIEVAQKMTGKVAEGILKQNAWIPYDSQEGRDYWDALQIVRNWTKVNHESLHDIVLDELNQEYSDRFWNEHNFVFKEGNTFHHAKGATPINNDLLPDSDGRQIIPLNMGSPILIVCGNYNQYNRGFAPHGAGRIMSRRAHRDAMSGMADEQIFNNETKGLDIRFKSGQVDITELPSAYKDPDMIRQEITNLHLAYIVDEITPYGSIMNGGFVRPRRYKK